MANAGARDRFHELLSSFSQGMLVTRTPAGPLRARPMAVAEIDAGGDVWFVTSEQSGKIEEIQADPHVCVTFQSDERYLSLTGQVQLVPDRAKIRQLWKEAWRPWFPKGEEDPSLILLRVNAHDGEFWDHSGVQGLKFILEAAKARVEGRAMRTDPQQHQKVDL